VTTRVVYSFDVGGKLMQLCCAKLRRSFMDDDSYVKKKTFYEKKLTDIR